MDLSIVVTVVSQTASGHRNCYYLSNIAIQMTLDMVSLSSQVLTQSWAWSVLAKLKGRRSEFNLVKQPSNMQHNTTKSQSTNTT